MGGPHPRRPVPCRAGGRQWSPASFVTPFVAGLYRLPLGAGARGGESPPRPHQLGSPVREPWAGQRSDSLRLGVLPEITVLTLRAAG